MKLLAGEVKTLLKNHAYGYNVSVVRSFNESLKVFPRIVVTQINNPTMVRSASKELVSMVMLQIDIFSQDDVDSNGKVKSRVDISDEIAMQVDDLIYSKYGANRDSVSDDTAYARDTVRKVLRYSCAIDDKDNTYRIY